MEYIIEYGLFLAKVATLVVALMLVIGMIVAAGSRQRKVHRHGEIIVECLNHHLEELHDGVRAEVLDKAALKIADKERSKQEKKDAKEAKKKAKLDAKQVSNTDVERRKRVYVLDFDGDVAAEGVDSLREEITAVLSFAEPCDEVVLKLESPGGMVHAYGLAASQLQRIKDAKIPLTICVDKVAASGGYMMACLADRIVAAPFAIIGSIGVVVQLPNFYRVLQKNEVDYEIISAGEYKRTLSTFGEITEKGRAKVQEDVENIHDIFKRWVKGYRPSVDITRVATGETWVGMQAKERYLVDELNTSDEVLVNACKEADVYEVSFKIKKSIQEKLGKAVELGFAKAVSRLLAADRTRDFH